MFTTWPPLAFSPKSPKSYGTFDIQHDESSFEIVMVMMGIMTIMMTMMMMFEDHCTINMSNSAAWNPQDSASTHPHLECHHDNGNDKSLTTGMTIAAEVIIMKRSQEFKITI